VAAGDLGEQTGLCSDLEGAVGEPPRRLGVLVVVLHDARVHAELEGVDLERHEAEATANGGSMPFQTG
jgi:hypothetical protein